jgi:hypothetical protein
MITLKKTLFAICFIALSSSLFAQIGVRAGISIPNQNFEQDGVEFSFDNNLGLTLAALFEIGISDNFAIQPELAFVQKGTKTKIELFGMTEESKLRINYIDIPVLAKFKFGTESIAAYVAAGPTFGYAITGSTEENGDKTSFEDDDWDGYNRLEIGANAGAGIGIPMDVGMIFLDFRYLFSLTNLSDDSDITYHNKGICISIGFATGIQ